MAETLQKLKCPPLIALEHNSERLTGDVDLAEALAAPPHKTNLRFFSSRRQKDVTFCRAALFFFC